jgi:hypothetical protein
MITYSQRSVTFECVKEEINIIQSVKSFTEKDNCCYGNPI